jgi:DNA-binding NtrC family response regulator
MDGDKLLPARIVVVHDDHSFLDPLTAALRENGHEVAAFDDPLAAWDALESGRRVQVLVTRVQFAANKPHGVALATRTRASRPSVHVVFVAPPELQVHTTGLGTFMPTPAPLAEVVKTVDHLLGL